MKFTRCIVFYKKLFDFKAILCLLFTLPLAFPSHSQSSDHVPNTVDLFYSQPYPSRNVTWNGYNIYLSSPRHINHFNRGECGSRSENFMGIAAAIRAAIAESPGGTYFFPLRKRGYQIKIGRADPVEASLRSNDFGADAHIPIHSNSVESGFSCSDNPPTSYAAGTRVAFRTPGAGNGAELAENLRSQVGNLSPGSSDNIYWVAPAAPFPNGFTNSTTLAELELPNAPSAYLETEFHTWRVGSDFVNDSWQYYYRIAEAIDMYFSYPR